MKPFGLGPRNSGENSQIAFVGALQHVATNGISTKSSSPFAGKSIGFGVLSIRMDSFSTFSFITGADRAAAQRLMRKLLKKSGRAPCVMITDKLKFYGAARKDMGSALSIGNIKGLITGRRTHICRRGDVSGS